MNVTSLLTEHVVDTNWGNLPSDVIEPTKKQILDTLGVALAGSTHEGPVVVADIIKQWGGKEEGTILACDKKVPCVNAALVNGYLAGVTDFDDYNDPCFVHASRENVPACFATAESKGGVNGKDFLVAVALGYDIAHRLSRAVLIHNEGNAFWDYSTVASFFSCATSASKLLGLNREQLINALAIALQQTNGLMGGIVEGMSTKGLHGGRAAAGGIFAALLAERGLTGISDPLEGKNGFYEVFYGNIYYPDMVTVDLGKVFAAKTGAFKPYPCCGFDGTTLDATLSLVKENDIKPGDVDKVMVESGRSTCATMFEPRNVKVKPPTPVASEFSIPWAVASAIVYRKIGIENFTEEGIKDTRVLELAPKVYGKLNPEFNTCEDYEPATVEIKTKDGKVYSKHAAIRYGHWKNPMSFDAIIDKFKYCCGFSAKPIPTANQDKVIEMVKGLEDVSDVGEIIRLLG